MTESLGVRTAHRTLVWACRVFACLGIAGILMWCALRTLFFLNGPQPADAAAFGLYVDVAPAWAVGAAVTALVGSTTGPGPGRSNSPAWAAWCDLGMLLAFLWPLQAAVVALLLHGRARWQRGGAALAGAALLVAGATWGLACYRAARPRAPRDPSRVLELLPDGRYRTNFVGEDPYRIWETRPPVYLSGQWTRTGASGGGQSIVLNGSETMDVYGASSPSMLCEPEEQDPCYLSLQRK